MTAAQLRAIRENARAIMAMTDALLATLEPTTAHADGPCQHPKEQRLAAPRMGAPDAWMCAGCGAEGERIEPHEASL